MLPAEGHQADEGPACGRYYRQHGRVTEDPGRAEEAVSDAHRNHPDYGEEDDERDQCRHLRRSLPVPNARGSASRTP
ncbi:MAG: hypothetical protein ACREQY_19910, partial [Candidatus Binatia bacterium]